MAARGCIRCSDTKYYERNTHMFTKAKKQNFLRLMIPVVLLSLLVSIFGFAFSESAPSLELSDANLVIAKGKTAKLTATLSNASAKLTWESDDPSIAAVANGTVTGKQSGSTTIKCKTVLDDGTELSSSCEVTVFIPLQSIKTIQSLTIDIGQQSDPLEITLAPADAGYHTVIWSSDNEDIATVNEEGRITGVAEGTCTVTATSTEPVSGNAKAKSASCKVTVYRPVSSIALEAEETTVSKGKTIQINAIVSPEDATNKKLTWESSDSSVATVTNGKVTGKSSGNVTIKCFMVNQTGETVSAEYQLTVITPVSSIAPQNRQQVVNVGSTSEPLVLTVLPADATCKDATWSSQDESIATVDSEGRVTGIKAGKTTITATSIDPYSAGKPKSCVIQLSVNQGAEGLSITGDNIVAKGKTAKLTCTISPEDTTNKKIDWSSSDEKVARVSNGTVTAVGVGSCTITGTMADGSGVSATHDITVIQAVTQIQSNNKGRIAVTEGKTVQLGITVLPNDATSKEVTWSSSSTSVATVDSNGLVSGKSAGTCVITATAADGSGKNVKINVTVEPKVPLDATTFTRSGYFGAYYEFAITFKNLTKTRTIKYIQFDLKYSYNGSAKTYTGFYTDHDTLGPGRTKRIGWWDQLGYRLSYCSNFRVYLRSVKYSDGTWEFFDSDEALLGWF